MKNLKYISKFIFLLIGLSIIFLFLSCEKKEYGFHKEKVNLSFIESDSIKLNGSDSIATMLDTTISPRTAQNYQVVSFTGERNVVVGQAYTYTVVLDRAVHKDTYISITSNKDSAIRLAFGDTYYKEINKKISAGQSSFTFVALVVSQGNDISFTITSYDTDIILIGNFTGIVATVPSFEVTAPSFILPNESFSISCVYKSAPNTEVTPKWETGNFIVESSSHDKKTSMVKINLKSRATLGTFAVHLKLTSQSGLVPEFDMATVTCNITVGDPFNIIFDSIASSTCNKIFEMPGLQSVKDAKITWMAGDGLTLISDNETGRAIFSPVDSFQGYTIVKANIIYNNKIYEKVSKEIWVGLPKITSLEDGKELTWRHNSLNLKAKVEGAININWKIISGSISFDLLNWDYATGVCLTSSLPYDQCETAVIELSATNLCGETKKRYELQVRKTPKVIPDRWVMGFPKIINNRLTYELVFKASKDYFVSSLYTTCLYNGAYDGYYNSETWDWIYKDGYYLPPVIDSQYGTVNRVLDVYNGTGRMQIKAGTIKTYIVYQQIAPGKHLQDIEYFIMHLYDSSKVDRYQDANDFVYEY